MLLRFASVALFLAVLSLTSNPIHAAAPAPAPAAAQSAAPRITLNFDNDWRFFKGEPPAPPTTQSTTGNYPPIDPPSFAFKDDTWRKVTLPHDWAIEGPFDEKAPHSPPARISPAASPGTAKPSPSHLKPKESASSSNSTASWPTPKSTSTKACWAPAPTAASAFPTT